MDFYILDKRTNLVHHLTDLDAMLAMSKTAVQYVGWPESLRVLYPICRLIQFNRKEIHEDLGRKVLIDSCVKVLNYFTQQGVIDDSEIVIPPDWTPGPENRSENDLTVSLTWECKSGTGIFDVLVPRQRRQFVISTSPIEAPKG